MLIRHKIATEHHPVGIDIPVVSSCLSSCMCSLTTKKKEISDFYRGQGGLYTVLVTRRGSALQPILCCSQEVTQLFLLWLPLLLISFHPAPREQTEDCSSFDFTRQEEPISTAAGAKRIPGTASEEVPERLLQQWDPVPRKITHTGITSWGKGNK